MNRRYRWIDVPIDARILKLDWTQPNEKIADDLGVSVHEVRGIRDRLRSRGCHVPPIANRTLEDFLRSRSMEEILAVDWTLPNREIAAKLGISGWRLFKLRRHLHRMGHPIPSRRRGLLNSLLRSWSLKELEALYRTRTTLELAGLLKLSPREVASIRASLRKQGVDLPRPRHGKVARMMISRTHTEWAQLDWTKGAVRLARQLGCTVPQVCRLRQLLRLEGCRLPCVKHGTRTERVRQRYLKAGIGRRLDMDVARALGVTRSAVTKMRKALGLRRHRGGDR